MITPGKICLLLIFILALIFRFLYFPDNVNFAYDQARDSFAALEILKGNFKVIGPPTTASDKIFHGALFYYIWAPVYFLSNHNPEAVAAVMKVVNALGVFLVFIIGKKIFNSPIGGQVGLVSALLYAVSFEQTQYSLFLGHPSFGVIAVLIFYLGLTLWIFAKQRFGFIITLLGFGLALQFEDANILLLLPFITILIIFKNAFKILDVKTLFLGALAFLGSVLTFILVEIKYNFRTTLAVVDIIRSMSGASKLNLENYLETILRFVGDNVFFYGSLPTLIAIVLLFLWLGLLIKSDQKKVLAFLGIWFFGGLVASLINSSFSYYYTPAATVSLLIFVAFLLSKILNYKKMISVTFLMLIVMSNIYQIVSENYKGPNSDIVIQPGMVLSSQKQLIEYVYKKSDKAPFSVSAITVPLNVNTTWSYLFEWYGQQKYGYLPVWGSESASGFYGNLRVETVRSNLPTKRFLIIEPPVGIEKYLIDDFIKNEDYFSKIIEEKQFGTITVQAREQI